jgi:hypothetical protein
MAKWPKDAIEGVNVHKVIPRPTALRAVGKKGPHDHSPDVALVIRCYNVLNGTLRTVITQPLFKKEKSVLWCM